MTDVPIYVAVITAGAGLFGALASLFAVAFREGRQAKRDRREREETAKRQACLDLLRVCGQIRTQVASNYEYHGTEMADRLAAVRRLAADADLYAVSVSLQAPDRLAAPASALSAATTRLARKTADDTDLSLGSMAERPDYRELEARRDEFRRAAAEELTG